MQLLGRHGVEALEHERSCVVRHRHEGDVGGTLHAPVAVRRRVTHGRTAGGAQEQPGGTVMGTADGLTHPVPRPGRVHGSGRYAGRRYGSAMTGGMGGCPLRPTVIVQHVGAGAR
ncbi:hypothetical protein CELD12_23610 [Cellulomonas sp. NTE-D12]|nr:hypothetical protein CELD12_23610 [Cellulomonas sp. NTE-D12]